MAVALVRAVAQEGSDWVLTVRKKPNDPAVEIRVDEHQLAPDLKDALTTGEVKIEDGVGEVKLIDPRGRNAHITIAAEHLSNYNITGWFDSTDPAFGLLQQGQRVGYRVIVRRKKDSLTGMPMVDPSVGILSVGNDQKVRDMTYCGDPGALPPTVPRIESPPASRIPHSAAGTQARCEWCEQPTSSCECGAPEQPPAPSSSKAPASCAHGIPGSEQCPHCLGLTSGAVRNGPQRSLSSPAPAGTVPAANRTEAAGKPASPPQEVPQNRRLGARLEEGKPWVVVNSDGTLNLGSYAFDGIVECLATACEMCEEYRQRTRQQTSDSDLVRRTTKALLLAADAAQASVRPDGRSDSNDASHKRARYCVRLATRQLEPPWQGDSDEWRQYVFALGEHASLLMTLALSLFEEREAVR